MSSNNIFHSLVKIPFFAKIKNSLDSQHERDVFVISELLKIRPGSSLLDAGCGSQRYRRYCDHLVYSGQDFGAYEVDEKRMLGGFSDDAVTPYTYGSLKYVGNIWDIAEEDSYFDAVLCTEVLEHIPYPIETIGEFSRLIKPGGIMILTAPSNCLRHMDPYFFYSGFSDRWYEEILSKNGFELEKLIPVGDYYSWMSAELARTFLTHSFFAKLILLPAFLFFYAKKPTELSRDTMCKGYFILARKKI